MKKLSEKDINRINELHNIYAKDVPQFVKEIIEIKEMQRLKSVGQNCGRDYISEDIQSFEYNYSRLHHSIGVALIIWNFTTNREQTIAGLLHDIATPTFSHVIDYYNNDEEKQESTEVKTADIIRQSIGLKNILEKYKINVENVIDYSIYPIADNNMPQLSADRLEYNLYMATSRKLIDMHEAKEIYDNIQIKKNEKNEIEMCFSDIDIAKKFFEIALSNGEYMSGDVSTVTNKFFSDILKFAVNKKILKPRMFMDSTEEDIVNILDNNPNPHLNQMWNKFKNFKTINRAKGPIDKKYNVKSTGKKRYVNPLIKKENEVIRISELDNEINNKIKKFIQKDNIYYYI